MNSDELKGKWTQLQGSVKQQWGKLTDNEVAEIEGNQDKLVGKIQEKYGVAREEAERQVKEWNAAA
ncbi:MAG: CsbD family protein [Oricola sp.]|nr:CsbD family protein [Oricola sp.]